MRFILEVIPKQDSDGGKYAVVLKDIERVIQDIIDRNWYDGKYEVRVKEEQ